MLFAILLAQEGAKGDPGGGAPFIMQLLPFVALAFLFYYLLIRPMQKQERERKAMASALKKNDRVVTQSGIIGTILRVKDNDEIVTLKLDEGKISILKGSIARVLPEESSRPAEESASD